MCTFWKRLCFVVVLQLVFVACAMAQDMAIINANIATMEKDNPKAQAMIVKGGRIVAVGSTEELSKKVEASMKVLDLGGKFVMPGFIEGHAHFLMLGEMRMNLDLTKAQSWEEIVEQVRAAASQTPPGKWIVGRGWHQSKWDSPPSPNVEGYPTHESLSEASPNNPVLLTHASGHMDFANGYAMRLAGVTDETKDPKGGEILRSKDGVATGVFRERASGLIHSARFADEGQSKTKVSDVDYLNRAAELASDECVRKGITSFQDAGLPFAQIEYLKSVVGTKVKPRLWVMVRDTNQNLMLYLEDAKVKGYADEHLTVGGIKRAIDGALGAHGAWLLQPYEDLPLSRGLNTRSVASIEEAASLAIKHGYQFCVHAIGDRANREVLDIFQRQFEANPSKRPRRWRIEHAQHLHPDDISRFGKLGVIASMQAVHCTSDAVFVPKRLGHRRAKQGAYVWKSLVESGAVVTNGTDAPVEDVDPIPCFHSMVTRQIKEGVTFFPEQCLTRQQALEAYTINNAFAAFEEGIKGSIKVGKLADFVVLSNDLLTCTDEEILETTVLQTVIGGETVFERQ
jgi:predicted amidohydrolase YtcJ